MTADLDIHYLRSIYLSLVTAHPQYIEYSEQGLERDKSDALKLNKGNFDAKMKLSPLACDDLKWWHTEINSGVTAPIQRPGISASLTTDASGVGWGTECNGVSTGGQWSIAEQEFVHNINYLPIWSGLEQTFLHRCDLQLLSWILKIFSFLIKIFLSQSR